MTTLPDVPVVDWEAMEALIAANGLILDRPRHTAHPHFLEVVYPLDYGYVNGTVGEDGEPIDVFVGSGPPGLVAATRTIDRRKGDTELKLLYACTPEEIYLVHGFLNYAPELMTARLVTRGEPRALWQGAALGGELRQVELRVKDLPRATAFYADFLGHWGYRPDRTWQDGASFRKGRTTLALVQAAAPGDAAPGRRPGLGHLAFSAPSRAAVDAFVAAFLAPRGLPLLHGGPVAEPSGTYAACFEDPDGLELEVAYRPRFPAPPPGPDS